MATFPNYAPLFGAQKQSQPKVRSVEFGDGYQQRLMYGLPSQMNPKQWSLVFDVTDTAADEIEAFLDDRAEDAASFDWSPPDTTSVYKWVCRQWQREMYDHQRSRISVQFVQVFEP